MRKSSNSVVFFDLDDTLIPEVETEQAVLKSTCQVVEARYGVDVQSLCDTTRRVVSELFASNPYYDFCVNDIGITPWELLWGDPSGSSPELIALEQWVEWFRQKTWVKVLEFFKINDPNLAKDLVAAFVHGRQSKNQIFPEVPHVLETLQKRHPLAVITNGAPKIQEAKLIGGGLQNYFERIIISGTFGEGKPKPGIFLYACREMKTTPEKSVYVGNSRSKDIRGSKSVGMTAVLVNRTHKPNLPGITPDYEVHNLDELPNLMEQIDG